MVPLNCYSAEAERLIRRLHVLMIAGQSDSDEAEAVRDGLDVCHRHLSPEESFRIDHISVDLWKDYDQAKGRPEGPHTAEEVRWLQPITPQELDEWEAAIDVSRRDEAPITHDNMLRLIAEVRALRQHLYPTIEPVTSPTTSPVTSVVTSPVTPLP